MSKDGYAVSSIEICLESILSESYDPEEQSDKDRSSSVNQYFEDILEENIEES